MTLTKYHRYTLLAVIFAVLGFVGWACSERKSDQASTTITTDEIQQSSPTTSLFFTEKLNLRNASYLSSLIKFSAGSSTSYWQWVKTKQQSRGTIVFSLPFTGIDWSGDSIDQRWSAQADAITGFSAPDVDGPLYKASTSQPIFYQKIKKESVLETGAAFSENGYDVLYVYHRFYAGRDLDDYVNDVVEAVNWLKSQNAELPLGLYGEFLGGFIVSQATKKIPPGSVKAVLLVSPLLSWRDQEQYLKDLNTLIPNETKRNEYLNFFEPFARRFATVEPGLLDLPQISAPTLLIHDEWDTLVPISQIQAFQKINSRSLTEFQVPHASSFDLSTAQRASWQPGHGENPENNAVFYLAFAFNHLGENTSEKVIPYSQTSMDLLWREMYDARLAGRDVHGFQNALKELCHPQFSLEETQHAHETESGTQYLTRKLNEVWGRVETEDTVCGSLENSSL